VSFNKYVALLASCVERIHLVAKEGEMRMHQPRLSAQNLRLPRCWRRWCAELGHIGDTTGDQGRLRPVRRERQIAPGTDFIQNPNFLDTQYPKLPSGQLYYETRILGDWFAEQFKYRRGLGRWQIDRSQDRQ
jgi:hypothetical protein